MASIALTADGTEIYVALEDGSGLPVVLRAVTTQLEDFIVAYEPGDGSAVNIASVPSNLDLMLIYGDFGTDVKVIQHTVSTNSNADISPASLGAAVVNGLDVNPEDAQEIYITVNTAQDLLKTSNGGGSWTTKNSALGVDPTAVKVAWPNPDKLFVTGAAGGDTKLLWSTNGGTSFTDQAGSALQATLNICGLDLVV